MPITPAAAALKQASKGLRYPSETDAPFTAFVWKKATGPLSKKKLLERAHKPANSPVEEIPVEEFFHELTASQDWHRDQEKAAAADFRALYEAVRTTLRGVKVFKVGRTRRDVYLVGRT